MKAWVVTISSLDAVKGPRGNVSELVLAVLSARRTGDFAMAYVENLVRMFRTDLCKQLETSRYTTKRHGHTARISGGCHVCYVDQPYIFEAWKSDILNSTEKNGVNWLTWKGIKYTACDEDSETHAFIKGEDVDPLVKSTPQANFDLGNRGLFAHNRYHPSSQTDELGFDDVP